MISQAKQLFSKLKKPSLTVQVFAGLVIGIAIGAVFPALGMEIKPLAVIFLRMIKMLIAPLLFATLVVGIAGTGSHKTLGRMGAKTIGYFTVATIFALFVGLLVANLTQPGMGIPIDLGAGNVSELSQITENAHHVAGHSFWDTLVNMFPTSVVDAMARGEILQLVVFSVFFALALSAAGDAGKPVLQGLESLADVMLKFVGFVMVFAPMGVMAAIAATVGKNGLSVLLVYAKLVSSLYLALIIFMGVVLFTVCWVVRIPIFKFLQAVKEPFVLAFSTASSEAAFPKAMENMEKFGVPKSVVGFVLPTGYSFNLDGSTLYLALASLFIAQMAGIDMPIQQQLLMMLTLMITSKGIAAVPRASLVILAGLCTAFGLPLEGIAVILGIDHVLDMGRTSVNLVGNCLATAVVARWEGILDDEKMLAFVPDEETDDVSEAMPLPA
ncbi:MAG: cation:dicarboxylase symporter family transporter [Vampirovibrio sp.]|nr:cation:dicarboxylase symporter family transporter [Vampirovibrio sp.]